MSKTAKGLKAVRQGMPQTPEARLSRLGINLPESPAPFGSYIPAVTTGNLVFLSGMLPLKNGRLMVTGKLGAELTLEQGALAAKQAAVVALSALKAHIGSLDKVVRCVKLTGYIASAPGFGKQPQVLNTASDFMVEAFGEKGRHTRVAVGVAVLPLDSPVELECVFEFTV